MRIFRIIVLFFCVLGIYACQQNTKPINNVNIISPPAAKMILWAYYLPKQFITYYQSEQIVKLNSESFYPNGLLLKNQAGDTLHYIKPGQKILFLFDTTQTEPQYTTKYSFNIKDHDYWSYAKPPKNYQMQIGETYTFIFISQYDSSIRLSEHNFIYNGAYYIGFEIFHTDLLNTKSGCKDAILSSSSKFHIESGLYNIPMKINVFMGPFFMPYNQAYDNLNTCISETYLKFRSEVDKEYSTWRNLNDVCDSIWASASRTKSIDFKKKLDKSEQKMKDFYQNETLAACNQCLIDFFDSYPLWHKLYYGHSYENN